MRSTWSGVAALSFFCLSCAAPAEPPKPAPEPAAQPEPEPAPEPTRRTQNAQRSRAVPDRSARSAAEDEASPLAQAAPAVAKSNRCVTGQVRTRGEIIVPVKNAKVSFFKGTSLLGETRTDSNGKFAWCAGPNLSGSFEVTVRVSKPPFQTVSQSRDWEVGTQEEFDFALVAEGL